MTNTSAGAAKQCVLAIILAGVRRACRAEQANKQTKKLLINNDMADGRY